MCISSNVKILAHDTSTEYVNGHTKIGTVNIGDNVYIGYGAIILPNVHIGSNAIIGAGSVVTKNVPTGEIWGGNPAKRICSADEFRDKCMKDLQKNPVWCGPIEKWWDAPESEKKSMREKLTKSYGYMK